MEVHWVGRRAPCSVEVIRIENLIRQGFPSAGRAAVIGPGPTLSDAAELLFNRWNQLIHDRIAIGSDVRGVHGIRIVVIRISVVDYNPEELRQFATCPVVLNAPKGAGYIWREMVLLNHHRIMGIGVFMPAGGQDDLRIDKHRTAPEF